MNFGSLISMYVLLACGSIYSQALYMDVSMRTERELLHQLPLLPDLQCAWLVLAMCASPRANHALRNVPPQAVASYAHAHDAAIWETLELCLGGIAEADVAHAQHVATLPAALGGLGLRSAIRTAPAAYWAAWADALPELHKRSPAFAEACTRLLATDGVCVELEECG